MLDDECGAHAESVVLKFTDRNFRRGLRASWCPRLSVCVVCRYSALFSLCTGQLWFLSPARFISFGCSSVERVQFFYVTLKCFAHLVFLFFLDW